MTAVTHWREQVEGLRAALADWYEAREAWAHREPFEFPEDARQVGWTSEEWIDRKVAWMAIGDRADRATRKLEVIARAAATRPVPPDGEVQG